MSPTRFLATDLFKPNMPSFSFLYAACTGQKSPPKIKKLNLWVLRFIVSFLFSYLSLPVFGHNVAQKSTALYLTADSVSTLSNALSNSKLTSGSTLTYIIQFTPIQNGGTNGVAGYVTAYIPSVFDVIGADIVTTDGVGNYTSVPPSDPGEMPDNCGPRSCNTFTGLFLGYSSGKLSQLYGDTGIFYSTDSRTKVYPNSTQITQGSDGYYINPTSNSSKNPITTLLNESCANTHNEWDAINTVAFGQSATSSTCSSNSSLTAPNGASVMISGTNAGQGPTPYLAGSPVAGPQSGYYLDYTASTGPWNRIYYSGSRKAIQSGAATSGAAMPTLSGGTTTFTDTGITVSSSDPLSSARLGASVNAIRWAIGGIYDGVNKYVRLKVKLNKDVGTNETILLGAEVFGGDASGTDGGKDNPWRYHVPSVASANSSLAISKKACKYDSTATTCSDLDVANYYTANSTITYKITALNFGSSSQSNVTLTETISPCTKGTGTIKVGSASGIFASMASSSKSITCASSGGAMSTTWSLGTVAANTTGTLIINMPNSTTTLNTTITNVAKLTSSENTSGASASAVVYMGSTTMANLQVSKTSSSTFYAGKTISYTIVVSNSGLGAAANAKLKDTPDSGLDCTSSPSVTCASNSGNNFVCPSTPSTILTSSTGGTITTFNANSSGTFTVTCTVLATGQ